MKNILYYLAFLSFTLSAQNELQWKNRKPFADYWQQDVNYNIKAKIDERKLTVSGKLELTYTNNSPDTLFEVFFHTYQNAFTPHSHYHNLQVENGVKPWYGLYEKDGLGTKIEKLTSAKGVDSIIYDNTIVKVLLTKPILPHESTTFDIEFSTYWGNGSARKRMKAYYVENKFIHFNGVHWYPRISVYDRKFGWTTDQHLDKEFYGDFGTFDVELNFANDYIVEATGKLTNEDEMLPAELKKKLHISNFYHRGDQSEADTLSIPLQRTGRKTWKYHAENVHDFAFTADPTYRLDESNWSGIRVIAVVEERNSPKWKTATQFSADVIKVYSEDFGFYHYPKMVVADARDGMEYPMLTLNQGKEPNYRGLLAHEIGHNWFYGMLGSNETYRAMMDEGFTQFLTAWSLIKIDGEIYKPYQTIPSVAFLRMYRNQQKSIDMRVYDGYLNEAIQRVDPQLNTHSSDFGGGSLRHGGGYRQVYSKTAAMLYNLQYTLGDTLFLKAMQHYVNQWKFAHPYPEDFRTAFIQYTKVDLNWFFDQWMETNKVIDYAVGKIKELKNDTFLVEFKRIGEMQMPIDFRVTTYNDSVIDYHIPNTWFIKNTKANILEKWYGWGNLNKNYTAKIVVPGGIANVQIDPSEILADINLLNNSKKLPYSVKFNAEFTNPPNRREYEILVRPDLWWNKYDGLKAGARFKGNYMNKVNKIDATLWLNSGLGQGSYDTTVSIGRFDNISYRIDYSTILPKVNKNLSVNVHGSQIAGLHKYHINFEKKSNNLKNLFIIQSSSIFRSSSNHFTYALNPEEWNLRKANNSIELKYAGLFQVFNSYSKIHVNVRTSAFASDYNYDYLTVENKVNFYLKKFKLKTRLFAFGGIGKNWAPESMLYLAGANPEEQSENKYTRAEGFFSKDQASFGDNTNTFHSGGGLNLRGYAGYLAPETVNGTQYSTYKGTNGASVNLELEFDRYLGINSFNWSNTVSITTYAFADLGVIDIYNSTDNIILAQPRADAGLGAAFTIEKFYRMNEIKPLTVRLDFPLLLNRVPNIDPVYFKYRWIVGINRAF